MVRSLKVTYFKNRCAGTAACIKEDPSHFQLDGDKAKLLGSKGHDSKFILEGDFDDEKASKLIAAAKSCPLNAILVSDIKSDEDIVSDKVEQSDGYREVVAEYDDEKEFVLDNEGYFLIRTDKEKKMIEVAFCDSKNKIKLKVTGKKPIDIYQTIINKENLNLRKDHASYLGRELQKAYTSLQLGIDYVQDDEPDFSKIKKE